MTGATLHKLRPNVIKLTWKVHFPDMTFSTLVDAPPIFDLELLVVRVGATHDERLEELLRVEEAAQGNAQTRNVASHFDRGIKCD